MTRETLDDDGMSAGLAARLERVAREVAAEWGLRLGPRIAAGRYSYVAPAGDAILKVIPPEDEAIAAAIAVGRRIWRPARAESGFPTIDDDVRCYLPHDERHELVPAARRVYRSLTARNDTVIHADFHHHNILRRGSEWVVIDPKPMRAEPEYDLPPFLWNPLGTEPTRVRTERRIRAFADAGLEGDRIRAWAIVRGVMLGLPTRPWTPVDDRRPQFAVVRALL